MRVTYLKPAAGLLAAVAVVSAVLLSPQDYSLKTQRALGLACPPGMVSELELAETEGDIAEPAANICVPRMRPESFMEYQRAQVAKDERMGQSTPGALRAAVEQKAAMQASGAKVGNADARWAEYGVGPMIGNDVRFPEVNGQGFSNLSGRIDQFAYDDTRQRLFVAVGNGGIWVSEATDGDVKTLANSWKEANGTGGAKPLPILITSGIGYSKLGGANGSLIALTGEHSQGGNSYVGMGAYWSDDSGATWNRALGVPDEAQGFHVEVDPQYQNIVYLATGKGLFRSTDIGRSFVNVALPTSADCAGVDGLSKKLGDTPDGMGKCLLASMVTDVVVQQPGGVPEVTCGADGCPVVAAVGYRAGLFPYLDGTESAPGNGIYKSADGVAGSFTKLAVSGSASTGAGFAPQERIGRIELGKATGETQNHNYLYAIVEDAVLFNGGLAPILGLPVDDAVTAVTGVLDCSDLPDDEDVQFACTLARGGATLGATTINGVYVSANFGDSWTRMADTVELAVMPNTGSGLYAPSALGVGPGVQAWYDLWIAVDPTRVGTAATPGVPTRIGFGIEEVWQNRNPAVGIPQNGTLQQAPSALPDFEVIGPYFAGDRCQLLIGTATPGVPICPTDTMPLDPNTTKRTSTHPDQQAGMYIPTGDGGVCLFAGGDGGMFRQCVAAGANMDSTQWGSATNEGFHSLFHYGLAVAKDGTVYFGNQDNGSGKIEPVAAGNKQFQIYVGDGVFVLVDPDDSNIAYVETPGLALNVTTDGGGTYTNIKPTGVTNAYFASLILMDPTDKKHLLVGGTQIFETTLGEATRPATWTQVFDLGTGPSNAVRNMRSADTHGKASYVGFCGPCSVYGANAAIGFDRGIATNVNDPAGVAGDKANPAGWHFAKAEGLPNRYINWIEIDPDDATGKTIYVGLGGYTLARWLPAGMYLDPNPAAAKIGAGNLWKSTDGGDTFVNFSGNLPDARVTTLYKHRGQLYVGTEIGPFIADAPVGSASAPTYAVFGKGMPSVVVSQFQAQPGNLDRVFASTFGRGMWSIETKAGPTVPPVTPPPTPGTGSAGTGRFGGAFGVALLPLLALAGLRRRRPR